MAGRDAAQVSYVLNLDTLHNISESGKLRK